MRALYNILKGIYGALIPSFPTKNQPDDWGRFGGPTKIDFLWL